MNVSDAIRVRSMFKMRCVYLNIFVENIRKSKKDVYGMNFIIVLSIKNNIQFFQVSRLNF